MASRCILPLDGVNRFKDPVNVIPSCSVDSFNSTPHAPRNKCNPFRESFAGHACSQSFADKSIHTRSAPHSAVKKFAWEERHPNHQMRLVQPFRRRNRRNPPKCVPPLDLTRLNLPDGHIDPIEVLASSSCTPSSQISWGRQSVHCCSDYDSDEKVIACGSLSSVPASSQGPTSSHQKPHKDKLNQLEAEMLSYERSMPFDTESTPRENGIDLNIPDVSLHKRLRFEARIATQNGRDIHRELCGFYFFSDNSIAVYEFRQFGKKSSTLPLVPRGVYHHCINQSRGKPYEINYIKKGSTLQFESKKLTVLPSSLRCRALLSIRVTRVDEHAKRDLLYGDRNPMECRKVDSYLASPLKTYDVKDSSLLQTLQGMFCSILCGRARKTLVGLGRYLSLYSSNGVVSFVQLQQSLRKFHISLTVEDMQRFWKLLSCGEAWCHDPEGIVLDLCLQSLTGGFSEDRACLVRQVFMRLDVGKSGFINIDQMKKFFIATTELDIIDTFKISSIQSEISFADFENFHLGVSVEASSDSDFKSFMKVLWKI